MAWLARRARPIAQPERRWTRAGGHCLVAGHDTESQTALRSPRRISYTAPRKGSRRSINLHRPLSTERRHAASITRHGACQNAKAHRYKLARPYPNENAAQRCSLPERGHPMSRHSQPTLEYQRPRHIDRNGPPLLSLSSPSLVSFSRLPLSHSRRPLSSSRAALYLRAPSLSHSLSASPVSRCISRLTLRLSLCCCQQPARAV